MKDTAVTPTNNKRYTKVDEYEAFLIEEENDIEYEALLAEKENGTESIEYEERLIDYDKNYESYDLYLDWDGLKIFY